MGDRSLNFLLLAFEGEEAQFAARLAQRLKAHGHGVHVASCDHYTVTHMDGVAAGYYRRVGLRDDEFSDLSAFYAELNDLPADLDEKNVDWNYLREFEHKYCKHRTLLELVTTDPILSGAFHHRNIYYRPDNKAVFFKMLELKTRWLDRVFNALDFDAIVTVNFQYFVKAAMFTMAEARSIPFLMVSSCRVAGLHLIFDNFSLGTPGYVVDEMKRLQATGDECADAKAYAQSLISERKPAYTGFESTMRRISSQMSIWHRLYHLLRMVMLEWRPGLFVYKHYRGLFRPNYFLPGYFALLKADIVGLWRRIGYFRHARLVSPVLPDGPFVFFPLHLIPENSVLTLSKTFNELECLFQLSKVLPPDWKVVVKVNPNMLVSFDCHPNSYYLEMAALPNVQFVHPSLRSGDVIVRARAVAAISGTALLEGALYGKPGFRWGRTEFEVVDIVHQFDPARVRDQIEVTKSDNVLVYVQACFNLGFELDVQLIGRSLSASLSAEQEEKCLRQLDDLEHRLLGFLKDRA
jgi:hypothetical protein